MNIEFWQLAVLCGDTRWAVEVSPEGDADKLREAIADDVRAQEDLEALNQDYVAGCGL